MEAILFPVILRQLSNLLFSNQKSQQLRVNDFASLIWAGIDSVLIDRAGRMRKALLHTYPLESYSPLDVCVGLSVHLSPWTSHAEVDT